MSSLPSQLVERSGSVPPGTQSHGDPPVALLGVPFDNISMAGAVRRVEKMIASGRPHYVVTANVDFLVQARKDVELRRILLDADLVLCDGTPLVWMARWLGNPLPERVAGSDLVPALMRTASERDYRVFFLGATPECASLAVERLTRLYPGLQAPAWYSPPFRRLLEMDHEEIRRRILQFRPDLLLVSFGCPKQEKWIAMHYRRLGVPVAIGVGATIDFLAGQVRRAPVWMRRSGTEWIFRLMQEPRRLFRRYARDLGVFGVSTARQWWHLRGKWKDRETVRTWRLRTDSQLASLSVGGPLDRGAVEALAGVMNGAIGVVDCLLDVQGVTSIDSTGLAWLTRLQRDARAGAGKLVLVRPSSAVTRALRSMRLEELFLVTPDEAAARELVRERRSAVEADTRTGGAAGEDYTVRWPGEVTSANAEQVWEETVLGLAAQSDGVEWKIDLSEVRFIDSTGADLMRRAHCLADSFGARLEFAGTGPTVRNVLEFANLADILYAEDHAPPLPDRWQRPAAGGIARALRLAR